MNQKTNGTTTEEQERLNLHLSKCSRERASDPADRVMKQRYLARFLFILDKCPHAIKSCTDGKDLIEELKKGADALKAQLPNFIPRGFIPNDQYEADKEEGQEYKDLFLFLLEKYPNAIAPDIGGDGLVLMIKEGAEVLKDHFCSGPRIG